MGNFKSKLGEGVNIIKENSKEATDIGGEMTEQADQINAILESIDLQDSEDIQAMSDTGNAYQSSFDSAFSEQVETKGAEVSEQSEQVSGEADGELSNVRSGISKLEQASSISEIGKEAGDSGAAKLEGSAEEYESIITDAESVADTTQQEIQNLKSNLSGIFG